MNLTWSKISEDAFSRDVAQLRERNTKDQDDIQETITIRINYYRSAALERSVITNWGWEEGGCLHRFHARATFALGSAVVNKHTIKVVRSA